MEVKSFREVVKAGKLSVNPTIRHNQNGYPFITVLDPSKPQNEQAENIYFGKKSAAKIAELGLTDIRSIATDMQVISATNAEGEPRTKLSFGSMYVSADELFGA